MHHIIPERKGGTNIIDNAAPLCAKCHADFGDNEQKRKEILKMRDWWYEQAVSMFKTAPDYSPILERIDSLVLEIQQHHTSKLDNLKKALAKFVAKDHEYLLKKIDSITPATAQSGSSNIVSSSPVLIDNILCTLTPMEEHVMRLFFGIGHERCTLEEISIQLEVPKDKIQKIISKAIRKLKHPSRSRVLKEIGVDDIF